MRTYGRTYDEFGNATWHVVTTDSAGFNDAVWLTTLCQTLLLNLGESPFYANFGIPAYQSVMTQVFPDFYMIYTQQQFSQYFASLIVSREPSPTPTYMVNVTATNGAKFNFSLAVPF